MSLAATLAGALRLPGIAWSFSRAGYRAHARRFDPGDLAVSLAGKTCLVTGANKGIGFAIAGALAARDADVVLLCRDRERGSAAAERLAERGRGRVDLEVVDVSDLASVRALASRLAAPAVDVLVHNAGALFDERVATADGLERTFALHVVGPETLTRGLLARLRRARGRVIYLSSGGMYAERLDVAALLDPPSPFDGVRAYARAKRAQVVLAQMWAERAPDVSFYAMHPGWVNTAGVEAALPRFYRLTRPWLRTAEEGADTAVWLAATAALPVPDGAFVFDRAPAARYLVPGTREDAADRDALWSAVEARAG